MGLAGAFRSGTDEAFLYDTLLQLKTEDKFKKISGKAGLISNIGIIAGMALGGFLFAINKQLPYILTAISMILSLVIILLFIEPKRTKANKSVLEHTKYSFKLFYENKLLLTLAVFSVMTVVAIIVSFFLVQQYYSFLGIPPYLFGIIIIIGKLLESLSAKYADKVEKIIKEKLSLILIATLIIVGYSFMYYYSFYWAFIFAYLLSIAFGLQGPILSDYINKHISSEKRATVLSIKNQLKNVVFLIVPPLIGKVANVSIQLAFGVLALSAFLLYPIVIYILVHINNKHKT